MTVLIRAALTALLLPMQADEQPPELADDEARTLLVALQGELSAREPRRRAEALGHLAAGRHASFVKPAARLLKDRDSRVQVAAIRALGVQPFPAAQKALLAFLRRQEDAELRLETVRSLGRIGWGRRDFEPLRELFDDGDSRLKKELLQAFVRQREKLAFSLLVDHLDEPRPSSVNAASNPPESYWREKWQEWRALRVTVRRGLVDLTGQSFDTAEEYVDWAKKGPGRKLGFEYRRGR